MTKAKRQMQEDIKLIDLIIELVDARVPLSSRNPDIDELGKNKSRLILLNKSDLADERQNEAWKTYFQAKGFYVVKVDSRNGSGMKAALKRVGIELLLHERNKPVDGSEKLWYPSSVQPTNDRKMHQCVAFLNKMGCIIKGEEDNPILEDVTLFQFSKTERPKTIRENETPRQSPIQQRETIQHRPSAERGQPVYTCMKPDIKTNQNANQERTVIPDFDIIDQTCIKLNKPISLRMPNWNGILFAENARLVIGTLKRQLIPYNLPYNARQSRMYLYLGSKLLNAIFRIYGSDVCYFVKLDFAAHKAILRLYYEQRDEYGRINSNERH